MGRARLETAHAPAQYARAVAEIAQRFSTDAVQALKTRAVQAYNVRNVAESSA